MKNTSKFAVIGLGFIYPRHQQAIELLGHEVYLTCDIDKKKSPDYTDWREMVLSPKFKHVDYVSICTPNYTHAELCREMLKRGKKVICEKPLTIDTNFDGLDDVNVVLQLRQNPKVQNLKAGVIDIYVKTYREPKYFQSWKGQPGLSGGILMNMGVHYIDLLIFILGKPISVKYSSYSDLIARGEIEFEKGFGSYYIELSKEPMEVVRKITIDGEEMDLEGATIPLENSESVVNLHTKVYQDVLAGKGTKLSEARKSLELIEELKKGTPVGWGMQTL